jgi:tetratricopeptide (TPR) repeat protein
MKELRQRVDDLERTEQEVERGTKAIACAQDITLNPSINKRDKIDLLKLCSKVTPTSHVILVQLAEFLLDLERYDEAIIELQQAEKITYQEIIAIQKINNLTKHTESDSNILKTLQKNLFIIYQNLANALIKQSELLDTASDQPPIGKEHEVLVTKNTLLDLALEKTTAAIELEVDKASAFARQGAVYIMKDEHQLAVTALGTALKLNPDHIEANTHLQALKVYTKAQELVQSPFTSKVSITDQYEEATSPINFFSSSQHPSPITPPKPDLISALGEKHLSPIATIVTEGKKRQESKSGSVQRADSTIKPYQNTNANRHKNKFKEQFSYSSSVQSQNSNSSNHVSRLKDKAKKASSSASSLDQ